MSVVTIMSMIVMAMMEILITLFLVSDSGSFSIILYEGTFLEEGGSSSHEG